MFDQDRRMGRKAGIKSPPKEVLRNHGFLSRPLGTFGRPRKYLARRRNFPSRLPIKKSCQQNTVPNHPAPRAPANHKKGPAVPVGRTSDRSPPRCGSTREKHVFDQDRRMGRKAGIKSPPREVLRNRRFLSQLLGTFVWRQKYLARRRNLPSRPPTKKSYPTEYRAKSSRPTH